MMKITQKILMLLAMSLLLASSTLFAVAPASQAYVDQKIAQIGGVGPYYVGQYAQGGVVFYVDTVNKKGLVAAVSDLGSGTSYAWGPFGTNTVEAYGSVFFSGKENTQAMMNGGVSNAANAVAAYNDNNTTPYNDWYIPSIDELGQMDQEAKVINYVASLHGGSSFSEVLNAVYWSSSRVYNSSQVLYVNFSNSSQSGYPQNDAHRIRLVRAFSYT